MIKQFKQGRNFISVVKEKPDCSVKINDARVYYMGNNDKEAHGSELIKELSKDFNSDQAKIDIKTDKKHP